MVHEDVSICWCANCSHGATFICKEFLQLNTKLFNAKNNDKIVMITFVATVLLGKFSKDVLTALILSELGILV